MDRFPDPGATNPSDYCAYYVMAVCFQRTKICHLSTISLTLQKITHLGMKLWAAPTNPFLSCINLNGKSAIALPKWGISGICTVFEVCRRGLCNHIDHIIDDYLTLIKVPNSQVLIPALHETMEIKLCRASENETNSQTRRIRILIRAYDSLAAC